MKYLEHTDHPGIYAERAFPEFVVDLGEIRMNYAVTGDPGRPALLLIPGQSESWWGYEEAMQLLADRFQVYAVDLRGQGRSTWTPGRYSLDLFGGDLVRFIDKVIGRPVVVSGLSSGGVLSAWLSAFAAPGQILAAVYEDPPLFASETTPAVGPSIRQTVAGPIFELWHKWLGPQWSIGDEEGLMHAMGRDLPGWMAGALQAARAATDGEMSLPQQVELKEYDPEWGDAFASGRVAVNCDHETMLSQVKVPVLFTHHFHRSDPETGNLLGASSDEQARYAGKLVEKNGNSFTYRTFPAMPHSMHGADPALFAATITEWLDGLTLTPRAEQPPQRVEQAEPRADAPPPGDVIIDGTWTVTLQTPAGEQQIPLELATTGGELTGTLNGTPIDDGRIDGATISFKARLTTPRKVRISCQATITGNRLTGRAKVAMMPITVRFTGLRSE